jgi:hypothetical protein
MRARAGRGIDAALGLLALAFAAPSLTYPLSRDQALYWYVGRDWLAGAVPYRDVVEHKTPLVYAVYALGIALTGETMWAIRATEIAATLVLGWLASRLAVTARRATLPAGALGASLLVASVFYYGYLPFQDQGHSEIWCALFAAAAVVAARDVRDPRRAALVAGLCLGLAFVAKPPALAFAPLVVAALHGRRAGVARWAPTASLGFLAVVGVVVAYFASRGAVAAMFDVVVRANGAFALEGRKASTAGEWLWRFWKALDWFQPWSWMFLGLCLTGIARGLVRRDEPLVRRYTRPLLWAACAYVAVLVQLKFYAYQHALFIVPCALLGATLWVDLSRAARSPLRRAFAATAFAAVTVVTCVADTPRDVWWLRARNAVRFARGELDASALVDSFDVEGWIDMTSSHAAGEWVRTHAQPGEHLLVRGYDPQIYYFAGRRYGGRFFWSSVLVTPGLSYRRDEWLAADRADIERLRPAWVVTWFESSTGAECEAPGWFEAMGWERSAVFGPFVVLYRPPRAGAIQ